MSSLRLLLVFVALGMGGMALSAQNLYDFSLKYPRASTNCENNAKFLGNIFSRRTGLTVFKTECSQNDFATDSIRIWYQSPTKLNFVSTERESGSNTGFYASLVECDRDLPARTQEFENATGLSAIFAYCYLSSDMSSLSYSIEIDALGSPKKAPFTLSDSIEGVSEESGHALVSRLSALLAKNGVELSDVAFGVSQTVPSLSYFAIRYYAARSIDADFDFRNYASEGTSVCAAQKQGLQALLKQAGIPILVAFCTDDISLSRSQLYVALDRSQSWFSETKVPGVYPSFAACTADTLRVVKTYQSQLQQNALGALCVANDYDSSEYEMRVLGRCADARTASCALGDEAGDWVLPPFQP